jgi:hypothetical protein
MAVEGDLEEIARKELGCYEKASHVIWNDSETDKSVARIRLVNTENLVRVQRWTGKCVE